MNAEPSRIVLIVEDNTAFLATLADYLEGEGFQVLQAESAVEAFNILAGQPKLDLLITDYRLPGGVTGVMIAEPALKLRPDLSIIYMSGHPAEIIDSATSTLLVAPILAKPFSLAVLRARIDALLPSH